MVKKYIWSGLFMVLVLFIWNVKKQVSLNFFIIDKIFMTGLIILILGSILYVVKSGFFDLFFSGLAQIKGLIIRQSAALKEVDQHLNTNHQLKEWKSNFVETIMIVLLGVASGLLITSTMWALLSHS
ncbi:DUF3899 domain-containing protein [Niallia circulans]|uniref:DUF3899 domain-containing protein n=1 Tax=Niallia circulans TaxID=1397 RepID=A0A941GCV9_NIACI|nr:DUF3899 domain-containing protein [Niallia circulans]MCB5236283.1 DUF3899 domain-containing protein [Niallia circulans]